MANLGHNLLLFSFLLTTYGCVFSFVGGKKLNFAWIQSARRALVASCCLIIACSLILVSQLVVGNYQIEYVYAYSNSTMPLFYKIAALWGGQNGSLLWWLTILSIYSLIAVASFRKKISALHPFVISVLAVVQLFFLILVIFPANPFVEIPFAVMQNGKGLNPLLQNYYMLIHPPSLYLGYVGMTIPFAFGMAALISGKLDNEWILQIRKWTLTAWFFLSIGNLLGASWAYEVLGWGGYWAWDPVENAAFIPWLTASAFLHSVIIQEKRNMLKVWNMSLVILSFMLTLTGTFLTRSGIVSSVHAFAQSNIGSYFVCFLAFALVSSSLLLIYRLPRLQSKDVLDSMVSRESAFLFNNLVLVGSAFAILWGTLFPVLSEAVRGVKISVGAPYFNKIMVPIGLLLLLLTGIGPLIPWKRATTEQLKKNFFYPVMAAIITSVVVWVWVSHQVAVVFSFSFCGFVLATLIAEYQRGIAYRMTHFKENAPKALVKLVRSNERRYGGYVIHFGIVLMFIGFTGSAFKIETEVQLSPTQTMTIGDYILRYDRAIGRTTKHLDAVGAKFSVWKNKKPFTYMMPEKVFFKSQIPGEEPQPATNVAIHRNLKEDLYIALLSFDPNGEVIFFKTVVNPLVEFIWLGGLILILGTAVVMWPKPRKIGSFE